MSIVLSSQFWVANCLPSLAHRARGALVSDEAWCKVENLAQRLPPVAVAGFECRLDSNPQVDVSIQISRGHSALSEELPNEPGWRAAGAVCALWAERGSAFDVGVRDILFEFDLDHGSVPLPGVFLTLDLTVQPEVVTMIEQVAGAFGVAAPKGLRRHLPRIQAALPYRGAISRVGVMFGRGAGFTRLEIRSATESAVACLERIGWRDTSGNLAAALAPLAAVTKSIVLEVDVGEELHSRVGIECSARSAAPQAWRDLLEFLTARGLCRADKAAALQAWPGATRLRAPTYHGVAGFWPAADACCVRRISHLKVIFDEGRLSAAKGYLSFHHGTIGVGTPAPGPSVTPGGSRSGA